MKYLALLCLLLFLRQTDRTSLGFIPSDLMQFSLHTAQNSDKYLADAELQERFPITEYFYPNTRFWFLIYTYFDDTKIVIHDRHNLNLIYHVQDFSSLGIKNVHPYAQSYIQDEIINKNLAHLKSQLLRLSQEPLPTDPDLVALFNLVVKAGVSVGKGPDEHRKTFQKLARGLRKQRGLKNHIEEGLSRYNLYSSFLDRYFSALKLPSELIAIAFLESSFNPHAHSKSSAAGVWQLMPFLQRSFFPTHNKIDYRLNIGISSIAAAQLLKENFQILKRWDLALTAYNSGIKHILKERKNNTDLDLEHLIHNSEHSSFGFASKNFYAEFLALTRVLKFRDQLFPSIQSIDPINDLKFYFPKCDINLKRSFSDTETEYLRSLNHQLKKMNNLPKGTLISIDTDLSPKTYQKISWRDLTKKRPKNWMDIKKRYSCSTK